MRSRLSAAWSRLRLNAAEHRESGTVFYGGFFSGLLQRIFRLTSRKMRCANRVADRVG